MVVVEHHQPTERPTRRKREGKKESDVYMHLKLHDEENEKKAKGGEDEQEKEEGCTYTNAIERVNAQVEKKRQESFLVRAVCCYVIVDENEVHPYYHYHHLLF